MRLSAPVLVALMILFPKVAWARQANADDPRLWDDAKTVFHLAGKGFVHQFRHEPSRNALLLGGLTTGGIAFADNELSDFWEDAEFLDNNIAETIGDPITVAMGFTPLLAYAASRHTDDPKLRAYSLETLSSLSLAYAETVVLSQIPTHRRPRYDGTKSSGFFNTALRGKYSWPSGHLIAPVTITLKTWDYYGWKAAILPASIGIISTGSRLSGGWHYTSDMAAAVALSLSAHWATARSGR